MASESFLASPELQKFLMLCCICAVGVILKARFPAKEPAVVQKVLLQVFVPATLFRGLSKESVELRHMVYIGGGAAYVLLKLGSSALASYAIFGTASKGELAKYRRTAIFQFGTTASAQSVLPYLAEFVDPKYVGLGGMVDLPMKLWMLAFMPFALKAAADTKSTSSGGKGKELAAAVTQMAKDPITLSLVFGILTAMITEGGGTKSLAFAGKAIDALAGGMTPMLFFLIGLKLEFKSASPLYCMILLFATHGIMLIAMGAVFLIGGIEMPIEKFMVFFTQGAPSVVGMGVISAAVNNGVTGFNTDFAFDIVGLAFPVSAIMQCSAGLVGDAWVNHCLIIGSVLVLISIVLRLAFAAKFQEAPVPDAEAAGGNAMLQTELKS